MGALVVLGVVSVLAVLAARWSKRCEIARSRSVCVAAHDQAAAAGCLDSTQQQAASAVVPQAIEPAGLIMGSSFHAHLQP